MKTTNQTFTGVAVSSYPWVCLDNHLETTGISYAVWKSGTGDVTFKVQATLDNPATVVSCKVFDLVSAKTADFQGTYGFPINGVRIAPTVVSGAGTLVFQVLQAGN